MLRWSGFLTESHNNEIIRVSFFVVYDEMDSVSLDPDEDKRDPTIFDGLKNYMLNVMTDEECQYFKTTTLRNLAKRVKLISFKLSYNW